MNPPSKTSVIVMLCCLNKPSWVALMLFHHDFVADWPALPIPYEQVVDKAFDEQLLEGVNGL